ncbi:MAG TPA: (4Fe-4S)-binding protein [Eudoraea sp.]|nr:(4Fe-4S)-binding protein [Eudoraea sp.]
MAEKEIVKEYPNKEITIIWKPARCIHSAICVQTLPDVYDPEAKPWIKPENAKASALRSQVDRCPSGALTYRMNNEKHIKNKQVMETKVEALKNGPLLVQGTLEVTRPDGSKEIKEKSTAFCRCGASADKPYCDGTHRKVEFKG